MIVRIYLGWHIILNYISKYVRMHKRTIPSFAVHFLLVPGCDPSERHRVHIYSVHIVHCIYILTMPHVDTQLLEVIQVATVHNKPSFVDLH